MANWIETLTGSLEQKRQYKQFQARVEALPEPYHAAAKALQRYFIYFGSPIDGETTVTMMGDFVDLWDRPPPTGRRCVRSSATTRSSSRKLSCGPTAAGSG